MALLLFFASQGQGKRLYTWGTAEDISLDVDTKILHSFDGFDFHYSDKGYFDVWKDGKHQGRLSFAVFGTLDGSPEKRTMSDFDWTWEILENTPERISVRAYNNFAPFEWWMDLNVSRYEYLKITHYAQINTAFDLENAQFFYLIDANQETNPFIYYEKVDGTVLEYDYSTNQHFTQADTNFAEYWNRVTLGSFNFLFQDILDDDFFITRAYFGNMEQLDSNLPDTNGFAIGFSKGNQTLAVGQKIEIDPIIEVPQGNNWSRGITYLDGVYDRVYSGSIGAGHIYEDGISYRWDRSVWRFYVGNLGMQTDANFVCPVNNPFRFEFFDLDLNSVSDDGVALVVSDDWDSEVFDSIGVWADQNTPSQTDHNVNITTALNNSTASGREYIQLRTGLVNEASYTGTSNTEQARLTFSGTDCYIEYTGFGGKIHYPISDEWLSIGDSLNNDGNYSFIFSINSDDTNNLSTKFYLSKTSAPFQYQNLIADLNLLDMAINPTVDANCGWGASGFAVDRNCYYDINVATLEDSSFWTVDLNVYAYDTNEWFPVSAYQDDDSKIFKVDNNKSVTSWDKDTNSWYTTNQTIDLTCNDDFEPINDGSGCVLTKYRYQKLWPGLGAFIAWQDYATSVVMDVDGSWRWEFYSTDVAGNTGDTNVQFFYLDKVRPTVSSDSTGDWNLMSPALDVNLHMVAYDVVSGIDANWFRLDDNNTSINDWGAWQNFDANIMLDWNTFGDGNFGVQYFASDAAGWDSNSDVNGGIVYVLMDQNGPEWPVSLIPATGSYADSVTIVCSEQIWVRDLNYVVEAKVFPGTGDVDWNQIYNDTSNSFLFDFSYITTNSDTNMQLRCKHIDPDKNSGYFTLDANIMLQPDTGFDSITNATPSDATIITTASALFSVYASDIGNVSFCTFEIWKNTVHVADFNGTPPITDTNIGDWNYTYTVLVDGDTVYSYIFCQDGTGNTSAKVSTASYFYDAAAPPSPPVLGGGRGGGAVTITKLIIDLNALRFDPPAIDVFLIYAPFEQNEQVYLHMIEGPVAIESCSFSSEFPNSDLFSCEIVDSSKVRVLLNYDNPEIFSDLVETQLVIVSGGHVGYLDIRDRVINVAAFFPLRDVFLDSFPPILANPYIFGLDDDGKIVGIRYWFIVTFTIAVIVGLGILLKYKKGGSK